MYQCFPRLLPIGGFCNWKLEFESFDDNGAVKFNGGLKFKLAVGGFIDVFDVIFVADGTDAALPHPVI